MIYYIFYEWLFKSLSAGGSGESYFVKALNVFQYVTFRTAYATITALLDLARLRRARHRGAAASEGRAGDTRGGAAGAPGQARHADDGRRAHHRLGAHLDAAVGAAVEPLRLDHPDRDDAGFAAIGFLDDYLKVAKKQSLGLTGALEAARAVADRVVRVGRALLLHVVRAGPTTRGG